MKNLLFVITITFAMHSISYAHELSKGVGLMPCGVYNEEKERDDELAGQVYQWVLGYLTERNSSGNDKDLSKLSRSFVLSELEEACDVKTSTHDSTTIQVLADYIYDSLDENIHKKETVTIS